MKAGLFSQHAVFRTRTPWNGRWRTRRWRWGADGGDNSRRLVILGGMTSTREGYHRQKGAWQPSAAHRRILDGLPGMRAPGCPVTPAPAPSLLSERADLRVRE